MPTAEELIACSLTYRDSPGRVEPVADTFDDENIAITTFTDVLLHEARERLLAPIDPPNDPYLHPVDVDTDEPGIVDRRDELHILRVSPAVTRVRYGRLRSTPPRPHTSNRDDTPPPVNIPLEKAQKKACEKAVKALAREEKKADTAIRNEEKRDRERQERASETPEQKRERIADTKRKREEARRMRAEGGVAAGEEPPRPTRRTTVVQDASDANGSHGADGEHGTRGRRKKQGDVEELLLTPDASRLPPPHRPVRRRTQGGSAAFFESPVPDHRHLYGLQRAGVSQALSGAILRRVPTSALEIIQGPPGTGKTHALIERIPSEGRVFLCAPTNVGTVSLFTKCVARFPGETSLALPPERIPPEVPVVSNDQSKRIVCGTVSSRGGRLLDGEGFEHVFLDEAAQCMEAWVWTLLRPSVVHLCMAGDVKQLPSLVSDSGRSMRHDRSMMGRLLESGYPSTELTVQNRMAPELLALSNHLYDGRLTCGPHAPATGTVVTVLVTDGEEREISHSYTNAREAEQIATLLATWSEEERAETVVLAPYAEQCRLLLSKKSGVRVHTVDSFQGRESETIVLSVVRTGRSGIGFWDDARRVTVALTRARTKLVLVHSMAQPLAWMPLPEGGDSSKT